MEKDNEEKEEVEEWSDGEGLRASGKPSLASQLGRTPESCHEGTTSSGNSVANLAKQLASLVSVLDYSRVAVLLHLHHSRNIRGEAEMMLPCDQWYLRQRPKESCPVVHGHKRSSRLISHQLSFIDISGTDDNAYKSSRQLTGVTRNRCFRRPNHQSGENLVCPTIMNEISMEQWRPFNTRHMKYCKIKDGRYIDTVFYCHHALTCSMVFLFCPTQLSACRWTSVSPRP